MSATNTTAIINLPLFIGTDKPSWLVDWNGAMNLIDSAISALQTAEGGTATALASLAQSVQALSGTVEQHTTALQTVTQATAGNTGSINTINALIGNGQPTTTDKTIIGAINEIYADIGGGDGVDADEVNYNNTSSGLTATDVQAAIDEVNAKIPSGGTGWSLVKSGTGATGADQLNSLFSELSGKTITDFLDYVVVSADSSILLPTVYTSTKFEFAVTIISTNALYDTTVAIQSTGSTHVNFSGSSATDVSSTARTDGYFKLYKRS